MTHLPKFVLLAAGLYLALEASLLIAEPVDLIPADQQPRPVEALSLDDPVEPLVPREKRGGKVDDRVRALALFAAGRVAEQKQDYPRALRNYQRAFRFDPESLAPLREIVPLAFNLDRQTEAVRYALIMAEREPTDPMLLARLADYLTEEGETERAIKLGEKALELYARGGEKPSAAQVGLWMEMGRLYFIAKKYEQTARYFGEVYKALDNPQEFGLDAATQKALLNRSELAYQLFGESFLEAGRVAEAEAAFDKSNSLKSDEPLALYNRARVEAKKKQPAQALARLETYFDKHFATQGTGPYHLLSDVLTELGQQDQLLARLEKIHAADAGNVPLAYFLAQRYRQAGQLDKAEPTYRGLIERHKERPPLEAYQGLVDIYRQQNDTALLLATIGEAVALTNSLAPLGDSGKALLADADRSKAIVALARTELAADPAKVNCGARLAAALVAVELKDFAAADPLFAAALEAAGPKTSEVLVTWGLELFMANQYPEAVKVFRRGLNEKLIPDDNPTYHFYLSGALEMSGQTDGALEHARRAAELKKDSPRFRGRMAWIFYHAKRYDAARQSYQALIDEFDKNRESPEVRDVMRDARLVLSNLSVLEGKLPESEEWLEQVLDEFPEDVGALNDLGYLWADANKHVDIAYRMIQVAVAAEPKNMAYRDSLGWVLFRLEKYHEAVAELKAAAASAADEPDATILDHLAEALLKSGDQAGALEHWNRAAELFDKHADTDKARGVREKIAKLPSTSTEK